jgi:hypothetical protein
LGTLSSGDVVPLTISGQLLNGTPFEGVDCVWIVGKNDNPQPGLSGDVVVLDDASPNPFNPITRIRYYLPTEEFVRISVYDVKGILVDRLVARVHSAGNHVAEWDASRMSSGIYFYRLKAGDFVQTKKLILLK